MVSSLPFFFVAIFFFLYLFRYYMTGAGGPTLLAVGMVPVAFIIMTLDSLRRNDFYPRLGRKANYLIALVYIALSILVAVYVTREFEEIGTVRAGIYSRTDLVIGGIMVAFIMEYTRQRYFPLFVVNILLILYVVYGWVVPGLFGHPGLSWTRVVSALSVEMATGTFSRLPQLALTLIGSFLLVLSVLRGFGCIESLLKGSTRIAVRSPFLIPQSAVIGSFSVAAVSGSSAANAATTGSATIPAMIGAGLPRLTAASIETVSSLGGQLMPPVMGISAFLMADFLGKSYFDVVARGYAPALIYFAGVSAAVYLLSLKYVKRGVAVSVAGLEVRDIVNFLAYLVAVGGLVYLMGVGRMPAMLAAQRVFMVVAILLVAFVMARVLWKSRSLQIRQLKEVASPLARSLETFALITADLTLLLSTLGILTGAFVITGVPTKVGFVLMEAAGVNLALMILIAFIFGSVVGTGLPPAPTYIITAMVIAPFFIKAGIDPWVTHFFAFFVAVWGELTPPTSVVAAVTSKIADASFTWTMLRAIIMCAPLFLLMGGVFMRPELVLVPGASQVFPGGLVLAGSLGMTCALHGRYSARSAIDGPMRVAVGILSLLVVLHPSIWVAVVSLVPLVPLVAYGFYQSRKVWAQPLPSPLPAQLQRH